LLSPGARDAERLAAAFAVASDIDLRRLSPGTEWAAA
jgi:hypothetical protein